MYFEKSELAVPLKIPDRYKAINKAFKDIDDVIKVGDEVFYFHDDSEALHQAFCTGIYFSVTWFIQTTQGIFTLEDIGDRVFFSQKESKNALTERRKK